MFYCCGERGIMTKATLVKESICLAACSQFQRLCPFWLWWEHGGRQAGAGGVAERYILVGRWRKLREGRPSMDFWNLKTHPQWYKRFLHQGQTSWSFQKTSFLWLNIQYANLPGHPVQIIANISVVIPLPESERSLAFLSLYCWTEVINITVYYQFKVPKFFFK